MSKSINKIDEYDDLKNRLKNGDESAITELYDCFASSLYQTAYSLLANHGEAEDAVQDTFIAVVRYRRQLAKAKNLKSYLFVTLRNSVNRTFQKRKKQSQTLTEFANEELNKPRAKSNYKLHERLEELPKEQAEIVALKIGAGMTFEEIAEILEISANTAASRYRYALEKLKKQYGVKND